MPVTLESLRAAGLANSMLLITMARMSGMSPQIKAAFAENVRTMREVGQATDNTDSFLSEFEQAAQTLLREL